MQGHGKKRTGSAGARTTPPSRISEAILQSGAEATPMTGSAEAAEQMGGGGGIAAMLGETTSEESGMPNGSMGNGDGGAPPGMGDGTGGDVMSGTPRLEGGSDDVPVLVELRLDSEKDTAAAIQIAAGFATSGFVIDTSYQAIPLTPTADEARAGAVTPARTVVVRGTVPADKIAELEARADVVKVWRDTPIAPFGTAVEEEIETALVSPLTAFGTCPIGTCDCSPTVPKGTIADVATYLGVDQIWGLGYRGDTIVVGVVDGGITAQGRPINSADTSNPTWPNKLIPRVIGGWPVANWGTTGVGWGWHGNMCSTDVLGMAPNAQVYDIRIGAASIISTISNALAGFQWAIDQHRTNGTPQILTNSWGIFQETWDPVYARDANHPFTRKVVEALDEGILVLFAAGNCGATCPDGRCGSDTGPGHSIWGANGHPRVMTVGAVSKNEQFIGYSSQGPAALDPNKPDFCSVSHFTGFFNSDSGTSAATPIAAGVVALLKEASPALSQDQVKSTLRTTAKDIGPLGFDQHSGAGIIRPRVAFGVTQPTPEPSGPAVSWAANRLDVFVLGTNRATYHKWWNGSAWGPSLTGYESLGGVCNTAPEVIAWGANRLDAFVLGTNSALYHKWWNGSAWGPSVAGWEYLGGICESPPSVASWGANRLDIFLFGTDHAMYHKWWNGSAWGPSTTGYEFMGGVCLGRPKAVAWGPNRLDAFVLGTNRALYHKWWNGSSWGPSLTGYESLGGTCITSPEVVAWGSNRLDVFVLGTNRALYHKWWNGSSWGPSLGGWEFMGGVCASPPTAVSWGPNRLDVFVIGTDSALYHKWWNGSAWGPSVTGWEYMGGVCSSPPRVVAWGPNRLDVFVTGMNSQLYHKWWNGSAWGPSVTGWEAQGGVITDF